MKYRKKPVVIDAVQFQGDGLDLLAWLTTFDPLLLNIEVCDDVLVIKTLEGDMTARQGDWIIRGVKGEIYPCKPDIFDATYEALSN